MILRSLGTPQLCFYLLKPNQAIVPDEICESYAGKKIYRKDPKFSDSSSGQTVNYDQPAPYESV